MLKKVFILFFLFFNINCSVKLLNKSYKLYNKNDFNTAQSIITKKKIKNKNKLLSLMYKSNLLQYSKKFSESNIYYLEAEKLIDDFLKINLKDLTKSYILNDFYKSYKGETFEQLYVYILY